MIATFRVITNIQEAEIIWKKLATGSTIYSDWSFRYCFYKYFSYPLFFYTTYNEVGEPIACLPLQYSETEHHLEFFGGTYMEDNGVLVVPGMEKIIPEMYKQITSPAKLESIRGDDAYTTQLDLDCYKYVLPIEGLKNYEDYIARDYDSEARGKLRRKLRKVERENINIKLNDFNDLAYLIEFNRAQFTDHSSFNDRPHFTETFTELFKLGFPVHFLSFSVDKKIVAASFALLYGTTYEYFNLGVNPAIEAGNLRDLTSYVHIKNLEQAISVGATTFDAFTGDYGWKEHWRFQKIPQYKWIKN